MEEPRYKEMCVDDRICPSDLKCAICHCTYDEPVMLSCGHSFCSNCAKAWLVKKHTCPTCRASSSGVPIKNIALGQIVDEHNRILAEGVTESCEDTSEVEDAEDSNFQSGLSPAPTETFVRSLEVRLSRRIRKNASKTADSNRVNSLDTSPTRIVRFAASHETTPLHIAAARRRLEGYVYTGPSLENSPTSIGRFQRNPGTGGTRRNTHYSSPSRRSEDIGSSSPGTSELKRGNVLRRSLGILRRSVRLLKKDAKEKEVSIDENKEEEEKMETEQEVVHDDKQEFRRKSFRKSIVRRLRNWRSGAKVSSVGSEEDASVPVEPKLVASARILVIDSSDKVNLALFLRALSDCTNNVSHIFRVISSEERRQLPLLMEEYEGLTLVSIMLTDQLDPNALVLFDVYEGRREMNGQIEHCSPLVSCCSAVLLFCASDPSSALQASSDFRFVQQERVGNKTELPIWTIHAVEVESPRHSRISSASFYEQPPRKLSSLAHANRMNTSELGALLVRTKRITLQCSVPPINEFVRGIEQLLGDLKSVARPIQS